ncbi:hypothetical protein SAMN05421858_4314 [Haladaptatus litoreus]|uniref:Uncharacterized protein n=1 Tax=Haladaptatus litoreus TaxID=553468 RepID=A0A1N7EJP6_9EURY|nr:hypothetical protein SAMN05421858_4314 [Haladaptatus litoreus]
MQLLEPLMDWPPFHCNRICNPPSGHCRKLGFTNHSKNLVISDPNCWLLFHHSDIYLL